MLFARRVALLETRLAGLPSLLVALSGGVDSAVLLAAAARSVGGALVAATTRSPAVPDEEIADAVRVAARLGVPHRVVDSREMEDPAYRANGGDRCYFCRREMYGALAEVARSAGIRCIADGLQAEDDPGDRPGVRAAGEAGVLHPLRDAGFAKRDVRRLARAWNLPVRDKPAQPCLASRLPAGVAVTAERLGLVHRAERALRDLGFRILRVRCEGEHGRIEVGRDELPAAFARRRELEQAVRAAGFPTSSLDPRGYRPK